MADYERAPQQDFNVKANEPPSSGEREAEPTVSSSNELVKRYEELGPDPLAAALGAELQRGYNLSSFPDNRALSFFGPSLISALETPETLSGGIPNPDRVIIVEANLEAIRGLLPAEITQIVDGFEGFVDLRITPLSTDRSLRLKRTFSALRPILQKPKPRPANG